MAQRTNPDSSDDKVRLLLEAAKVDPEYPLAAENDVDKDVEDVEAEELNEEDKSSAASSSPSSLFKPAAARPKLVINRPPGMSKF
jgi:hypothetical protein